MIKLLNQFIQKITNIYNEITTLITQDPNNMNMFEKLWDN